jgi:uncharacterized protein with FMN-binding domain
VRKVTQNIVGVISLGVLATSWSLGQAAETGLTLGAPTASPTASDLPTTAPSNAPSTSASPTNVSSAAPGSTAEPTPTKTSAPKPSTTIAKTSDAISYVAHKGSGIMQLKVTKTGSKITDVAVLSGGTEGGDWAGVPSILAQAAIDAQGSKFGNVGGATHTTEAFKTALESALAKF